MNVSDTDYQVLESIANGADYQEQLLRPTTADESFEDYTARMNAAVFENERETVTKLLRLVDPNLYFDIDLPLGDQSPAPFVAAILAALTTAYEAGAKQIQKSVLSQIVPILEEAKREKEGKSGE